jgi:hypothetical protein
LTENEKHFGVYNVGSYWIYQNDSTLIQDSVYVYSLSNVDLGQQYDADIYSYEGLSSAAHSVVDSNVSIAYTLRATSDNAANLRHSFYYCCDTTQTSWSTELKIYDFGSRSVYEGTQLIAPLNQYIVNGNSFDNVYKTKTDSVHGIFAGPDIASIELFIAKDVGIIKWTIKYVPDSTVSWSILRYHVVR